MPIRLAAPADAIAPERMIGEYLRESYAGHLGTPAATLRNEVLAGTTTQRVLLAERHSGLVGFVAWDGGIGIVVLRARSTRIADLRPLVPALTVALASIEPGQVTHVGD